MKYKKEIDNEICYIISKYSDKSNEKIMVRLEKIVNTLRRKWYIEMIDVWIGKIINVLLIM